MLEMAARVRSRFIGRDYSWATALRIFPASYFPAEVLIEDEFGIALQ
jgi:hypothetical protein